MTDIQSEASRFIPYEPRTRNDRAARDERICRWIIRLALPILIYLSGQVLYWIWVDNVYGPPGWQGFLSGLPLVIVAVAATIWAIAIWSSGDLY
jgi:hypothetical protein